MLIKPIKTETDHAAARHEIERLWGVDEGTSACGIPNPDFHRFRSVTASPAPSL